jgi:hypothetical protein
MLNIPVDTVRDYDEIRSIDEAVSMEQHAEYHNDIKVDPKEEFRAHCSNMQAWVENDYNTTILFRNLAFPLLKKLVQAGDPKAKRVYKDELAYRLESNEIAVTIFLKKNGYLSELSSEELSNIIETMKPGIGKMILLHSDNPDYELDGMFMRYKGFIITDLANWFKGYNDYKRAFPLERLDKYSNKLYNSLINFGIGWNDRRVMFKEKDILQVRDMFESKGKVMVQIPRSKAPLRLYIEKENMAVYIEPVLVF